MQSIGILLQTSPYKKRNVLIYWSSSLLFGVQIKEINIWHFSICGFNGCCSNCRLHVATTVFWISCRVCFELCLLFSSGLILSA